MGPLVSTQRLAELLDGPSPPTLLDVRWSLTGPSARELYAAGHLPGAVFVDLDADLAGPPGAGGRHPLPEPAALQPTLRRLGVRRAHPVVAYDASDGSIAARLWWLLRWSGHDAVAVLDGGYAAWQAEGRPITAGEPATATGGVPAGNAATGHAAAEAAAEDMPAGNAATGHAAGAAAEAAARDVPAGNAGAAEVLVVRPGGMPVLDAEDAAALARTGVLLDARAAARYRGETEPIDPRAGHIPGARNAPAAEHLGQDGRWLPPRELARRFAELGARPGVPVGAYCGSGVTAAAVVLALELAGVTTAQRPAALYAGSWSHWCTDPSRPVATGERP